MKKIEMEKILNYHNNLYYNQDNPEIEDAEYDAIKNKYVELYGEYNYVPGNAVRGERYTHKEPVLSLSKIQMSDEDELRKEIERLFPVIFQPKIDGLTLVCYEDAFVTRGNGHVGEVVPPSHIAKVNGIGIDNFDMVRGEVVMFKKVFEALNLARIQEGKEPFKNARNAAAGILRSKEDTFMDSLSFISYNAISGEDMTVQDQMEMLKENDWSTVDTFYPNSIDEAVRMLKSFTRDMFPYEIDGIVMKHNGLKKFGSTGHHPKNAAAIKFEQEGVWTTLNGITFQTGKTGK